MSGRLVGKEKKLDSRIHFSNNITKIPTNLKQKILGLALESMCVSK